ncbi:hypothetical protein BZB76_5897 [Actinomadura pelletieri DSM 43383]|uniref:Uncharacterized protein n=1 Tax=Actinomadura pelletieri DSM 43383 TaxID=1120940 RepID=A0A495QAQ4_9ACTN|nr:hypothetical protein [Actinomadura pelletieri]RKS68769.1 hypothetical protein BZB76_5897 [Actinomadura pelletieri DSM 43383]
MPRKLPEVSTTQLIASATATAIAAFGASYLGVYGTIIGAALMSVISTAGSAVGKHYLDQGREQIKELTHLQTAARRRATAEDAADEATSADPTRTIAWSGDPNATRFDPAFGGGDPNATRLDGTFGADPGATRRDPVDAIAASLAEEAGEDAVRQVVRRSAWRSTVEWAKARWVMLVVSSAVVFGIVIAGITIWEATTGQPIGRSDKGLTVTNVLGGGGAQSEDAPSPSPSDRPTEPDTTPSDTPTGEAPPTRPSTPDGEPTTRPTEQPTEEPTTAPTTSQPTQPATPAPTEDPPGGGQEPGATNPQGRSAPTG